MCGLVAINSRTIEQTSFYWYTHTHMSYMHSSSFNNTTRTILLHIRCSRPFFDILPSPYIQRLELLHALHHHQHAHNRMNENEFCFRFGRTTLRGASTDLTVVIRCSMHVVHSSRRFSKKVVLRREYMCPHHISRIRECIARTLRLTNETEILCRK